MIALYHLEPKCWSLWLYRLRIAWDDEYETSVALARSDVRGLVHIGRFSMMWRRRRGSLR
jgi:hypothetical protein